MTSDPLPVLIRRLRFGVTAKHGASFSPEECAELLALVAPSQPPTPIEVMDALGSEVKATAQEQAAFASALRKRSQPVVAQPEIDDELSGILDAVFTAGGASVQYGWDVDRATECIASSAERILAWSQAALSRPAAPHPDTQRLNFLETMIGRTFDISPAALIPMADDCWNIDLDFRTVGNGKTLREAIDAAIEGDRARPYRKRGAMSPDWAEHEGRTNSSPLFEELVSAVEWLIRNDAHNLIAGDADHTARLILAQLAHVHGLAPTFAILQAHTLPNQEKL